MNTKELHQLLENPNLIKASQLKEINQLCDKYPYVQALHTLKLVALKKNHSFEYQKYIQKTICYTRHRNILKTYIQNSENNTKHLYKENPIEENLNTKKKNTWEKADLINTFIKNNPKIPTLPPQEHQENEDLMADIDLEKDDQAFITETLAKTYLKQNQLDKAIEAYRLLCLKNPEKSSYFEQEIEKIKGLKN